MNNYNIKNAYDRMIKMGWDRVFWAVDLHGTIIKPNYRDSSKFDFYPGAIEVLKQLSRDKTDCLILYTCSHPEELDSVVGHFMEYGISFTYVNENPEAANTAYGCYEKKPYFNILLDDKAGFEAETDWELIKQELIKLGKWQ